MGTLYLVRHGQARFGSDDYDRLSELGHRQCHALGQWFAGRGIRFDAVLRGTLRRHEQSLAALAEGFGALPEAALRPGLDEYDSEALLRAHHPGALPHPGTPEAYRLHFRLLREALTGWTAGALAPAGMRSWAEFSAGVAGVLDEVRAGGAGHVLLVSSGGPIGTAVQQVLGAPPAAMVELNMRIRNSGLTEFAFSARRHALSVFNHAPHLEPPERRAWETWA